MSQPENSRRIFIALDLPATVKRFLKSLSETLSTHELKRLRVVHPDNLHLTLRFLGHTSTTDIAALSTSLKEIATSIRPFVVRPLGMGTFPKRANAQVLWIGIGGDLEALHTLQAHIEKVTDQVTPSIRKPQFRPHITIGRFKPIATTQDRTIATTALTSFLRSNEYRSVEVSNGMSLIQSTLTPESAVYTQVSYAELTGQ